MINTQRPNHQVFKALTLTLLFSLVCACTNKPSPKLISPPLEGPLSIVINIEGIKCCDGVLRLALYNNSSHWMSNSDMVRGRLGFVQSEKQTIELHGLPTGRYAVAVYQDKDSDNKLDRWLGLIPKEPYGFSNNVGQYGPVSFKKASFDLTEDKNITIKLNSWKN